MHAVRDRALGILLFLPVPLVLWLFTRAPLGVGPSIGLGVVLVVTHRLYARPFALTRADRRCLWCGGSAESGSVLTVAEPFGTTDWRTCRPEHGESLKRVLAFAASHPSALKFGILGTLGLFLPTAIAADAGRLGPFSFGDARAFFRLGIASTVLPLGWLAESRGRLDGEVPHVPFPVHIQALIGTRAVLWLFRLVGIAWLVLGALHAASRLGVTPSGALD